MGPEPPIRLPGSDPLDGDGERWMEHLNSLYQIEFSLLAAAATVATIGAPLIVQFLLNLPVTCPAPTPGTACVSNRQLLLIPMVPFLLIMAFGYMYFSSRVVGTYTRDLERIISGDARRPGATVTAPALSRLSGALYGGETRHLLPLRIFYSILAASVVGVAILTVGAVIARITDSTLRAGAGVVYGALAVFCLVAYNTGASHGAFGHLIEAARLRDHRKGRRTGPATQPWSRFLLSVLLPRPLSVLKEQHALVLGAAAAVVQGTVLQVDWLRVLGGMLVFELLLYQTRYLLNGLREDPGAGEPLPANRRNDPLRGYTSLQLWAGLAAAAVRIWLFFLLAVHEGFLGRRPALVVVVLFLVCFYAYEIPRETARIRYRSALADAPGTLPQEGLRAVCRRGDRLARVMFVAAGAGYALRALVALLLVSGGVLSWTVAVLVGTAWALGCAAVGAGWAREFTGAVSAEADVVHPGLAAKPQLVWAARRLQALDLDQVRFALLEPGQTREGWDGQLSEFPRNRRSPWRAAFAVALLTSGLLAPAGHRPSVTLVGLMSVTAWLLLYGRGPWAPERDLLSPSLVQLFLVLGLVGLAGTPDIGPHWGLGVALTAGWLVLTMRQSEGGTLLGAILGAQRLSALARTVTRAVGRVAVRTLELLFGSAFVRSALKVFGRS